MDNRPLLPIRIGGEPIGIPTIAALWANEYHLDHRRFYVTTRDDVRIAGIYLDRADTDSLVIYVHGFMAGKDHHHVPRFVQAFSHFFDVMAIDLRGHGESGGGCTMGEMEVLDVEATIQYARSLGYEHITTIGSSMGGATVIRHAALHQSQNAVVTIGAFQAGEAGNVIAHTATLRFSIRTTTPEDRELVLGNVRRLIQTQAEGFGCTWDIKEGVPGAVLVNDPAETRRAAEIARAAFGETEVFEDGPTYLGSEDFAFMLQQRKGTYCFLGNGPSQFVHHPEYVFNRDILPIGAAYWVALTEGLLR